MISISVGKVDRSVGFGTYNEISRIKTAIAIDTVKKTSKREDGRGTIIIAKIPITKKTTPISFCPKRKFNVVPTCCLILSFFAKAYSKISANESWAKKVSILP